MFLPHQLIKPLPVRIHLLITSGYLLLIAIVNAYLYGLPHLLPLLAVFAVMIMIVYSSRFLIRRWIDRKMRVTQAVGNLFMLYLVFLMMALVLLYTPTGAIANPLLRSGVKCDVLGLAIECTYFYGMFALKGVFLIVVEVLVNGWRWIKSLARQKVIKRYIGHTIGNLANLLLFQKHKRQDASNDAIAALIQESTLLLHQENIGLVSLGQEIKRVQELAQSASGKVIHLIVPTDCLGIKIPPFVLVDLYKNMVKHGLCSADDPGFFEVKRSDSFLLIETVNAVAVQSEWVYAAGGTGIKQLRDILMLHYGHVARMTTVYRQNYFYLQIEIPHRY